MLQGNKFTFFISNILLLLLLLEINPCEPNPCQHNGRCSDFNGIATCECEERYSGDKCQRMLMILLPLYMDLWILLDLFYAVNDNNVNCNRNNNPSTRIKRFKDCNRRSREICEILMLTCKSSMKNLTKIDYSAAINGRWSVITGHFVVFTGQPMSD